MPFSREVRLGIVLYGGVSLAVYENGVAQELFRAVQGVGVYKLLKLLTDSDIVVDIMSGTSAGGINGIMLGYALVNHKDFTSTGNLWRDQGDILKLLRKPSDTNFYSVLDSQGYYQDKLEAAYRGMQPYRSQDGLASETTELDVFVTGTNVHGRVFTEFDEEGHAIDVKEHREVFLLSYRQGRKNELEPGREKALAKLSRITSCFPVAFEPVQVPLGKKREDIQTDGLLRRWGYLEPGSKIFFLDGGLLDNKPFSYTIDEIFRRTADRDVERMLFYVEPDPERFSKEAVSTEPTVVKAAVDALINIPGYESIAGDLQRIAEHNDRVASYNSIIQGCLEKNLTTPADCLGASSGDPNDLAPAKAQFKVLDSDKKRRCVYLQARLTQIKNRAVEGILKNFGTRQLLSEGKRHAAKILVESFDQWEGEGTETLAEFDVYFRLRRLFHLTYFILGMLHPQQGKCDFSQEEQNRYRDLWRRINHHIKLLEIIQFAMESTIDEVPIPWEDLESATAGADHARSRWETLRDVLRSLLGGELAGNLDGATQQKLFGERDQIEKNQRRGLSQRLNERKLSLVRGSPERADSRLLALTDTLEREVLRRFAPGGSAGPVAQEYCRFLELDSYLFPMQFLAGMESTDVIHAVRISPLDAQAGYSRKNLADKLCGNKLGHFSGFLKSSWRANDLMWGRLDGVCQLVECLLTAERVKQFAPPAIRREDLLALFPNSSGAEIDDLARKIREMPQVADPDRRNSLQAVHEALIMAAQREILNEELPNVIEASIQQQVEWNQYHLRKDHNPPFTIEDDVWKTGTHSIDRQLTAYAAARMAETPPKKGWVQFFLDDYKVGGEDPKDGLPKPIVLEIASNAGVVLRNCLVASAGDKAGKIRSSMPYRFFFKWPLDLAYAFAKWQRTAPEYSTVTIWGIAAVCVTMLAMELAVARVLHFQWHWTNWPWFAIPAAILALVALYVRWTSD